MKNLKAHHHLAIVSLLSFGIVSVWTWGTLVFASDTQITVYVGPPDVCQNIPGYQQTLPEGMQVENGTCFSPSPPPPESCVAQTTTVCETPQPATDHCENIDGTQQEIPEGMQRDNEGVCYTPAQITQPELPASTATKEPVPPGLFGLPSSWPIDANTRAGSRLDFLTPQIMVVVLTATVAVSALTAVRHHHHKIGSFSSRHHQA